MKRLISILMAICIMVFGTQAVFAASPKVGSVPGVVEISNPEALLAIQQIAVAPLLYTPNEDEPAWPVINSIMSEASIHIDEKCPVTIVTYDEAAARLATIEGADIALMSRRDATRYFKDHATYTADAYVEATVTNGSKKLDMFFNVYNSATHEIIFTYKEVAPSYSSRQEKTFNNFCKNFYMSINEAVKLAPKVIEDRAEKGSSKYDPEWNFKK